MPESKKISNLYQRLLAITDEVGKIEKTGRNQQQNYSYIESARVLAELRPHFVKHGVVIIQEIYDRSLARYEVTRNTGKQGIDIHAQIKTRFTIINADNPDERFTADWDEGEAIDSGDKASNKAATAAEKTFLMKLFKISDKDEQDPDGQSPEAPSSSSYVQPPPGNGITIKDPEALMTEGQKKMIEINLKQKQIQTPQDKAIFMKMVIGRAGTPNKGEASQLIDYLTKHKEDAIRTDIINYIAEHPEEQDA